MKKNLPIATLLGLTLVATALGASGFEHDTRQLVTFVGQDGSEAEGLWRFQWNSEERRNTMHLKPDLGPGVVFRQDFQLRPWPGDVASLTVGDWAMTVETSYPGLSASTFSEAMDAMEPGEVVHLKVTVGEEWSREGEFTVQTKQTEGLLSDLRELVDEKELLTLIPEEVRPSIRVLTEVVGPWEDLDDLSTSPRSHYAFGWTLAGLVGPVARAESGAAPHDWWQAVEGQRRQDEPLSADEEDLLARLSGDRDPGSLD